MPNKITSAGLTVAVTVLKFVYQQIRPWLKEQAAKNDTPLDEWALDLLDKVLGVQD